MNLKPDYSLIRHIFNLSFPIVLANALQSFYQLTDTFWVGRIGTNAVASLSICFPLIFLLLSIGIGFSIAGSVLVSQYKGVGDRKSIDFVTSQSISIMCFLGVLVAIVGYFSAEFVVRLIGAEGEVLLGAVEYLEIGMFGIAFQYIYLGFQNIFRAVGNVKVPLYLVAFTVCINFILDPLLIDGFGIIEPMGIKGAAYATTFTQALAAVIAIVLLSSGKHGAKLSLQAMKPCLKSIKRIFHLGLPTSLEGSTRALSMSLMTFLVASFGSTAMAVFGIGIRILSFVIIPALGFSQASSVLVGNSIGAGQKELAFKTAKYSLVIIFIVLTFVGALCFIYAELAISVFIPDDPVIIAEGGHFLKILALTFGFIGIQQVCNGVFRGAGNTMLAMFIAVFGMWVIRFPLAYVLSFHTTMKEDGIWWAFSISNIFVAIIALCIYLRKNWVKSIIEDKQEEQVQKTVDDCIENNL